MDLFERSHKLYRQLRTTWFILTAGGVLSFLINTPGLASSGVNFFGPVGTMEPVLLISLGAAAPGVFTWYKKSKALLSLESYDEKLKAHKAIWDLHKVLGTICAIGSAALLLPGLILIQVPITGWLVLASVHGGTIFYLRARKLENIVDGKAEESQTTSESSASNIEIEKSEPKTRKSNKFGWKVSAWIIAGIAVPIIFLTAALTPLFNTEFNAKASLSSELIKSIREKAPADFVVSETRGSSYGIDYVNPDSSFQMTRSMQTLQAATDCKNIIAWSKTVGVNSFMFDPVMKLIPISGHEAQAQIACVYSFSLAELTKDQTDQMGSTMFILRGTYTQKDKSAPIDIQLNLSSDPKIEKPYTLQIGVSTGLNFSAGELTADGDNEETWDQSYVKYQSVLDALGAYRKNHSTNDYFTAKTFAQATKTLEGIQLKPLVSTDGKVRLYSATLDDKNAMMLPMCVSIVPWDAEFAGTEDPGSGYIFGFHQPGGNLGQFGFATSNECAE